MLNLHVSVLVTLYLTRCKKIQWFIHAQLSHRFLLQFSMASGGGHSVLNVVETNPFRHLNHLSLKFVSASDTYLKKYLAECLLGLKVSECYN